MKSFTQQQRSSVVIRLLLLTASLASILGTMGFAPYRSFIASSRTAFNQQSSFIDSSGEGLPNLQGALEKCTVYEFILQDHKPLGCSVEESLANEPDGAKHVFVSQLTEGGNAEQAGMQVGDVVIQLSGTFDEVMDVVGMGLNKIRSLVSGREKNKPLTIRVARGSDVLERHEMALVDLCVLGEDPEVVECINTINSAYFVGEGDDIAADGDMATDCLDSETECMLDNMWEMWTEGLPVKNFEEEKIEEIKVEKKKIQPWASRSSGSGTWVRDPQTGEMRNIDE